MATNQADFFEDQPVNVVDDSNDLPALPDPEDVMVKGEVPSDVEVEVIDDTPEEDRRPPPAADAVDPESDELREEVENYSEKAKKRFDQLTYRYHEERRQREAATRQNEEAIRFAEQVARENQALKQALDNNTETLSKELDEKNAALLQRAEDAYRQAYENGDGEALVAAQKQMSALYAERMARPIRAQPHTTPPLSDPAPVAPQVLQAPTYPTVPDEKATRWLQENQWFQQPGYEEMSNFALQLHNNLVEQGIDPRTHDQYYTRINNTLRAAYPDHFAKQDQGRNGNSVDSTEKPPATASKSAPVAAPTRGGKAPRKVQVTSSGAALAKRLGVPLEEYAKHVAKLDGVDNG